MNKNRIGLSHFSLHTLAMAFMLMDHMWATFFPYKEWMTCIGRLAFPIFAFMVAEGFRKTSNVKKYALRMLVFALVAEIPFNLMYASSVIYPFHQNVLWTFLIAILLMLLLNMIKTRCNMILTIALSAVVVLAGYLVGYITFVDYYGVGILTVLCFYFLSGRKWYCYVGQFLAMAILNGKLLAGLCYSITIFGREFDFPQQAFAVLALIPIWLYSGRKGPGGKVFKYFCYGFYPVHMIVLYFLWKLIG